MASPADPSDPSAIADGLARLGVRRMLLAIHDVSFPSDPDEDVGRGSPSTRAAARLLAYVRGLGFTGIQLGPQGQTSRDNASPYDATLFSRHLGTIAISGGALDGLVGERARAAAVIEAPGDGRRADPRRAHATMAGLLDEAYAAFVRGARPELRERLVRFRRAHAGWLDRDALHDALTAVYGGISYRHWEELDARLWDPPAGEAARAEARRAELVHVHAAAIERYALGQLLAYDEHARVRATCARLGLALYGDLQIGLSEADSWGHAGAFARDYVMGAPPSRTNPDGQPWSYPVLDPDQYAGAAGALVAARADRMFADYDGVRIDHPHGLVCPWVYRAGAADPGEAVRAGARLFESPDLPDHPALARFAIAAPDQLDRALPRHHDRWVRELTPAQIERYAILFDALAASAARHGRGRDELSCEVLSTLPYPLGCVLARHQLGRWRVLQKANLDDERDVYRPEQAAPADWVMLGNHDTPPILAVIRAWSPVVRERWARHLAARLALADPGELAGDGALATAMLAELLASPADNVSIFFADLFGEHERFNEPGTYNDRNWTLRLPADFARLHRDRLASRAALDLPRAIELALAARRARGG